MESAVADQSLSLGSDESVPLVRLRPRSASPPADTSLRNCPRKTNVRSFQSSRRVHTGLECRKGGEMQVAGVVSRGRNNKRD